MKRLVSILLILLLTLGLLPTMAVSADDDLSVSASSTTVTVGQNVVLTLKYDGNGQHIGGIKGNITYDTNVFSYVSFTGTDVQVNGGAGKMIFIVTPSGITGPTSATITLTFKAEAPGNSAFKVTTEEFVNDTDYSAISTPTKELSVTAQELTLSDNANLKSLVPSKGTLTPKFDPNKTEYTISVSNSVTSLSLDAQAAEGKVSSISGKNALQVGKNTRVITVTAPNGTTKKYTVVITRAAAPSTTAPSGSDAPTATQPTIPTPPADALEVEAGGKLLTILDTQAAVDLPEGFIWSNLTINLVEVPAALNRETGMTLLYLTGSDRSDDDFYIYDAQADTFTRYRPLQATGGGYLLYDLPRDAAAPAGAVAGKLIYTNHFVSAYVYEDVALSDYYVVWAAPMGGEAGWYTYDKKEGTLQRYHATPGGNSGAVTRPSTSTAPTRTKRTQDRNPSGSSQGFSLDSLFDDGRQVLLIGGFSLIGLVVVVTVVLLIVSAGRRKNSKH